MAWMISNAVVQRDGKDNIQPIKRNSRGRIDGVVAALIAKALVHKLRHPVHHWPEMTLEGILHSRPHS